jgi:hypothetical protein
MASFSLFRTAAMLAALAIALSASSQTDRAHPSHHADVDKHGAEAMGFDQQKTTHRFQLTRDGGVIRVVAKDAADTASIEQIRMHLSHQARMFANGDFAAPQHTHGTVPPGVPVMIKLKDTITYNYASLPDGAELRLRTANVQALSAIHQFLKFQIEDHETGDPESLQQ